MNQLRIDQQMTSRQIDEHAETRIALRFLRDCLAWEHRLATLRGNTAGADRAAVIVARTTGRSAA